MQVDADRLGVHEVRVGGRAPRLSLVAVIANWMGAPFGLGKCALRAAMRVSHVDVAQSKLARPVKTQLIDHAHLQRGIKQP